jgi:Na+:H+ antiporter, NhaA family
VPGHAPTRGRTSAALRSDLLDPDVIRVLQWPGMPSSRRFLPSAVLRPFEAFFALDAASGILLVLCAALAIAWANLDPLHYNAILECPITLGLGAAAATFTPRLFINDGLMTVFFFVVGMEIKRELVIGALNSLAKASLPAIAALGGMLAPAGIFLAFNAGKTGQHGWGIPMATDIAFCIGILTMMKDRVPRSLIVFVTALAIFDDIGCILVIALFYGQGLSLVWLAAAGAVTALLLAMNRAGVSDGRLYAIIGAGLWYTVHHSGIHATIAGVVLGLMIPARSERPTADVLRELSDQIAQWNPEQPTSSAIARTLTSLEAPVDRMVRGLHAWVAFLIMPVFALANAGISLHDMGIATLLTPVALGIALGLFLGKQLGIFIMTLLAVKLKLVPMPEGASTKQLYGVSVIAGIGFTVALFIAALAYPDDDLLSNEAKLGIVVGSLAAGLVGCLLLRLGGKLTTTPT